MRSVNIKQYLIVKTPVRQSYGIFHFYYSNGDHYFFDHVHGTRVFSERIYSQVIIQKAAFGTRFGYYDFLIVFSEPPTPGRPY